MGRRLELDANTYRVLVHPTPLLASWPRLALRPRWGRKACSYRIRPEALDVASCLPTLSKTIIPDAQEHFLTHSTRRDTHLFGGFGLIMHTVVKDGGFFGHPQSDMGNVGKGDTT